MVEAATFPSTTPHVDLPLLFAGQAQKEFFLNQAFVIIDALVSGGIDGSLSAPPTSPAEGAAYRVLAPAEGDWTDQDDNLAIWVGGSWVFVTPPSGICVFDRTEGQRLNFSSGWNKALEPPQPSGGAVIDTQARDAIGSLIEAMRSAGFFAETP